MHVSDDQSYMNHSHKMPPTTVANESEIATRRERKKRETRERIYRAAVRLFSQRGLVGTSVEAITEAADVGKGTFFNYFPDKEHVLGVLAEIQLSKVRAALTEAEGGQTGIRAILLKLLPALGDELAPSPNLAAALLSAILCNQSVGRLAGTAIGEGRGSLTRILKLGQERGEVRGDRSPLAMALDFQEAFFGTIALWAIHPEQKLRTRLQVRSDAYWEGIAKQKGERL